MTMLQEPRGPVGLPVPGDPDLPDDAGHVVYGGAGALSLQALPVCQLLGQPVLDECQRSVMAEGAFHVR